MRDRKDMDTYIEKKVEEFRKEFKCIENGCDGDGNIPVQVSLDEWIADECQFHAEYLIPMENTFRQALTQTAEKARVEERELMKLEYNRIFGWLLGNYGDFPDLSKKPHYSFRIELREKLEALSASPTKN